MNLKAYLLVARQSIQDLLEYKFDFFLQTMKYALMVVMMTLIWLAVEREGKSGLLSQKETISYFIFSAMFYTLSNFHPWYIDEDIKLGHLSQYLLKPISPIIYYFFYEGAKVGTETLFKLFFFSLLLLYFQLISILSMTKLIIILLYAPMIFMFSFQLLSLISILSFWVTEAYAIRWSALITVRLASGTLVPLIYFPATYQVISFYLPFQHLSYTPIQWMLGNIGPLVLFQSFVILTGWSIALGYFRQIIWKIGVNNYEGTGI